MGGVAALICAISFAVLMLAAVIVVLKLARTMGLTNRILDDLRKEVIPMVGKLQVTMDHINTEMGYVDRILESTEKVAARANSMTKVAQHMVTSPLVKIARLGVGVQRALGIDMSENTEKRPGAGEEA